MKHRFLGLGALAAGLLAFVPLPRDHAAAAPVPSPTRVATAGTIVPTPEPAPAHAPAAVVVGSYDSRAVAIAWVRSKAFADYVKAQQRDLGAAIERAKQAGDRALAAELEAIGPAMQQRVHEQGFGTAPVDDVLARVAARLPGVATAAGVDVLVSKWELDFCRDESKLVDVTDRLAALFDPDEATLDAIRGVLAQDPQPPERLAPHK